MPAQPYAAAPLLLDLGEEAWQEQLDNVERWLGNVLLLASALRTLADDTVGKISEPHIRSYVRDVATLAGQHQDKAEQLYALIGRSPSKPREVAGTAIAKAREAYADVEGVLGGAESGWRDIQQLLVACVKAMGAFAVAEQLGLALGLPEVVDLAFPVVHELSTAQLLLQEFLLEMAPPAILSGERP
jgi:hypothetical protein